MSITVGAVVSLVAGFAYFAPPIWETQKRWHLRLDATRLLLRVASRRRFKVRTLGDLLNDSTSP